MRLLKMYTTLSYIITTITSQLSFRHVQFYSKLSLLFPLPTRKDRRIIKSTDTSALGRFSILILFMSCVLLQLTLPAGSGRFKSTFSSHDAPLISHARDLFGTTSGAFLSWRTKRASGLPWNPTSPAQGFCPRIRRWRIRSGLLNLYYPQHQTSSLPDSKHKMMLPSLPAFILGSVSQLSNFQRVFLSHASSTW